MFRKYAIYHNIIGFTLNSYLRPYDDRKLSISFTENVNRKLRTYLSISRGISNFSALERESSIPFREMFNMH